jgi:metallophosphoesterase (TIGR00282 family)
LARTINALVLGDVVGQSGSRALFLTLPALIKKYSADVVVVNGENAAAGFGIGVEMLQNFFAAGVHVVTSGNHIWQQKEILPVLDSETRLLRPHNYPKGVPGHGSCVVEIRGKKIAVLNLQGRVRMSNILCPFLTGKEALRKLRQETKIILIDFHAEEPEEKEALGFYLDGEASLVFGTHTHVQTADERILPLGTAYITDIGMIGAKNSVIGFRPDVAVQRSLSQMPLKMEVSDERAVLHGIVVEIDEESGHALKIERIVSESPV